MFKVIRTIIITKQGKLVEVEGGVQFISNNAFNFLPRTTLAWFGLA
jgi:hypothetical protein